MRGLFRRKRKSDCHSGKPGFTMACPLMVFSWELLWDWLEKPVTLDPSFWSYDCYFDEKTQKKNTLHTI